MKLIAKARFARLWVMVLLTGMSLVSFSALSFAVTIGEHYGGGIVFYVDPSGQHGLIAATSDIPDLPGSTRTYSDVPCGYTWVQAKFACSKLKTGGYHDWYLPSKDELAQLYRNGVVVGGFAGSTGGYWSSSEGSTGLAWEQPLYGVKPVPSQVHKSWAFSVRAVRAF